MSIARSRVTAQGQVTVPAEVRGRLGLVRGSILEWEEQGGSICVKRGGRVGSEDIHGALFPVPPDARTLRDLDEGIRRQVRARHARR